MPNLPALGVPLPPNSVVEPRLVHPAARFAPANSERRVCRRPLSSGGAPQGGPFPTEGPPPPVARGPDKDPPGVGAPPHPPPPPLGTAPPARALRPRNPLLGEVSE